MPIIGSTAGQSGRVPGVPTITGVTPGNASADVAFSEPAFKGKGNVTYTVTSSPGGFTGTGSSSPITVTGLTNGVSYTFTIATNSGLGIASSASSASSSVTPVVPKPVVSGGTLTSDATYYYRTFTTSDTLTITGGPLTADYVLVAGGGYGGSQYYSRTGSARAGYSNKNYYSSGAGAGGVVYKTSQTVGVNAWSVVIGGAGSASTAVNETAVAGGNGIQGSGNGGAGGSGGGGSAYNEVDMGSSAGVGGAGTSGQGYAGGDGYSGGNTSGGAGGGGSTQTGRSQHIEGTANGGAGGTYLGLTVGGGGGGGQPTGFGTAGAGGTGGGGAGGNGQNTSGAAGTANTGGGGGGGGLPSANLSTSGGAGGSGIFRIRYTKAQVD